jgi:hypothetical protein
MLTEGPRGQFQKMVSQQEKAFCVLRIEVSRSVIRVQHEFRAARFRKDASCMVMYFSMRLRPSDFEVSVESYGNGCVLKWSGTRCRIARWRRDTSVCIWSEVRTWMLLISYWWETWRRMGNSMDICQGYRTYYNFVKSYLFHRCSRKPTVAWGSRPSVRSTREYLRQEIGSVQRVSRFCKKYIQKTTYHNSWDRLWCR